MRYIIIAVILFFFILIGVLIFGRGPSKSPTVTKFLADYAKTDVEMQLTTQGRINGEESHREVVITIGRNERVVSVVQGYQGNVIKSEKFPNNENAYSAFLSALDVAGYSRTRHSNFASEAGQCPLGQRYIYEVIHDDKDNQRTWSTSCGRIGTFAGNAPLIRELFQLQINNYQDFVTDADL